MKDQIVGAYRIVRELGRGGMGVVYEAEHCELGIRYALKVLSSDEVGEDRLVRERFLAEGRVLARLRHPNLVRVYDMGFDAETGAPYYVLDLILGEDGNPHTLAEASGIAPDEDTLVRWFGELASALDYIHAQGVVHRDVKPGNLLVAADGRVVLSDFGVSRFFSESLNEAVRAVHTSTGGISAAGRRVFGTRGFIAPEVLAGQVATPVADVYALGVVFVYLLTGMWYERGTQILRMLDTYEHPWGVVLPPMLDDQAARPVELVPLVTRLVEPHGLMSAILRWWSFRGRGWWLRVLAAVSLIVLVIAGVLNAVIFISFFLLHRAEPEGADRPAPGRQTDYFGASGLYREGD